jgi:hypothetical protein
MSIGDYPNMSYKSLREIQHKLSVLIVGYPAPDRRDEAQRWITGLYQGILNELHRRELPPASWGEHAVYLDSADVKVMGGPFDGTTIKVEAVHRVIELPKEGERSLCHYELVYLHRGPVTKPQAEKIIGRRLE